MDMHIPTDELEHLKWLTDLEHLERISALTDGQREGHTRLHRRLAESGAVDFNEFVATLPPQMRSIAEAALAA